MTHDVFWRRKRLIYNILFFPKITAGGFRDLYFIHSSQDWLLSRDHMQCLSWGLLRPVHNDNKMTLINVLQNFKTMLGTKNDNLKPCLMKNHIWDLK